MRKATIVSAVALTMGMAPLAAADFDDGFFRGDLNRLLARSSKNRTSRASRPC